MPNEIFPQDQEPREGVPEETAEFGVPLVGEVADIWEAPNPVQLPGPMTNWIDEIPASRAEIFTTWSRINGVSPDTRNWRFGRLKELANGFKMLSTHVTETDWGTNNFPEYQSKNQARNDEKTYDDAALEEIRQLLADDVTHIIRFSYSLARPLAATRPPGLARRIDDMIISHAMRSLTAFREHLEKPPGDGVGVLESADNLRATSTLMKEATGDPDFANPDNPSTLRNLDPRLRTIAAKLIEVGAKRFITAVTMRLYELETTPTPNAVGIAPAEFEAAEHAIANWSAQAREGLIPQENDFAEILDRMTTRLHRLELNTPLLFGLEIGLKSYARSGRRDNSPTVDPKEEIDQILAASKESENIDDSVSEAYRIAFERAPKALAEKEFEGEIVSDSMILDNIWANFIAEFNHPGRFSDISINDYAFQAGEDGEEVAADQQVHLRPRSPIKYRTDVSDVELRVVASVDEEAVLNGIRKSFEGKRGEEISDEFADLLDSTTGTYEMSLALELTQSQSTVVDAILRESHLLSRIQRDYEHGIPEQAIGDDPSLALERVRDLIVGALHASGFTFQSHNVPRARKRVYEAPNGPLAKPTYRNRWVPMGRIEGRSLLDGVEGEWGPNDLVDSEAAVDDE